MSIENGVQRQARLVTNQHNPYPDKELISRLDDQKIKWVMYF
jgi:hypothetical protein